MRVPVARPSRACSWLVGLRGVKFLVAEVNVGGFFLIGCYLVSYVWESPALVTEGCL